jgi:hypothetical protein
VVEVVVGGGVSVKPEWPLWAKMHLKGHPTPQIKKLVDKNVSIRGNVMQRVDLIAAQRDGL